ncbi:MAG TPA: UDP-N-acetylglucosamine 1-carboxyvinyltransferase, partial [Bacteroidales bacterium]|nr:UDP-N-acetylglucosamine 1-carboxyvinyltransferase [Bacteroidales bacterium]
MSSFEIKGGNHLHGEIIPQGAKNEALQIISAVLLTSEEVLVRNIPDIHDVNKLIELVQLLGTKTERIDRNTCRFKADSVSPDNMMTDEFRRKAASLRGSVMILGPMLARFGKGCIPQPGGDKIGRRRLDTHMVGFLKLGAKI